MTRPSPYSNPQTVGMVGGTPIVAQLGNGLGNIITVTMTADYQLLNPPEFPERPPFGNASYANKGLPRVIANGNTAQFFKAESDALIDAGFATYVSG
jgi:hypothetical protein